MELEWSKKNLLELVKKAYDGEVMLPDFQRNFIWGRNDIEELIRSLLEKMFIGTFLIQRVDPSNVPFKTIPIDCAEKVNQKFYSKPEILILDGQQRISSLFYTLYNPDCPLKNTANPYVFFLDLSELAKNNPDEAVFSWSKQFREYKNLLDENGQFDIEKLKQQKILPLSFIRENDFWRKWYKDFSNAFTSQEADNIEQYLKNMTDYDIHILSIPLGEKPENIAILFERINRSGIKLSVFDLLTARLYKFLNLRTEWEKAFDENQYIKKIANNDRKNTKVPYYIIQAIALSKNVSIKASDMLKINEKILNQDIWNKAVNILENKVLNRLFDVNEYGIKEYKWIPYVSVINVWLALFLKAENKELEIDIDKINKWYWSVVFTERYSGSTETKQTKDFKDMVKYLKEGQIPEAVLDLQQKLNILSLKTKYSGSSIYKGVFNLLFKNNPSDFFKKDKIKFDELEDHHIFPRNFLEKKNVNVEKDIVLNRTLISSSTNKKISDKAPGDYIDEMITLHGLEQTKQILQKHFINDEMFEILHSVRQNSSSNEIEEKFNKFVVLREKEIKKFVKNLIEF